MEGIKFMSVGFRNITKCQIKEGISASDTTVLLESTADYVPFTASPGDYVYAIIQNQEHMETIKIDVAASSPNGLSVGRGEENSTARAWKRGALLYQELTASSLDFLRQKEVFRTFAYNPNGIIAPEYANEKVYQTGSTDCEIRWWKAVNATNLVWVLIAGTICDGEVWLDPIDWDWDIPDGWDWPTIVYKVAPPIFLPPGDTYFQDLELEIFCPTSNSTTYYTDDGSTPDSGSTEYTGLITVSAGTTFKAIAYKPDFGESPVVEAEFILQVASPSISPSGGSYTSMQLITITCLTIGATVYYTTDGTTPDNTSTAYTGVIALSSNMTTIKVIACKAGYDDSSVVSETYIFPLTFDVVCRHFWTGIGLIETGEMVGWGYNQGGQLAQGAYTGTAWSPILVSEDTTWAAISCGAAFIHGIKGDGTLWACGSNYYGQLGTGDSLHQTSIVQVGSSTNWEKIFSGEQSAYGIKTDGTLWVWGYNGTYQLGLGDTTERGSPVQLGALTNWAFVVGSQNTTVAIKTDGTMWGWGLNLRCILGLGDTDTRTTPTQIGDGLSTWAKASLGQFGCVAVKTDGTLWAWGYNTYGQCGQGDTDFLYATPVQIGVLTTWKSVAATHWSRMAMQTDGTLWGWGVNLQGELGLGDKTMRTSPTQVEGSWDDVVGAGRGGAVFSALKADKTLYSSGDYQVGALGIGEVSEDSKVFTKIDNLNT